MRIVDIARNEIGYQSETDGSSKYWEVIFPGERHRPYCLAFCYYCFMKAYGKDQLKRTFGDHPKMYPYEFRAVMKRCGRLYEDPEVGDIIFIKDGKWTNHCGIVVGVEGQEVVAVEGGVRQGEIYAVCEVRRKLSDQSIMGYGRVVYSRLEGDG